MGRLRQHGGSFANPAIAGIAFEMDHTAYRAFFARIENPRGGLGVEGVVTEIEDAQLRKRLDETGEGVDRAGNVCNIRKHSSQSESVTAPLIKK
jgi:hypothetical protein